MNELIRIETKNDKQLVSARELHDFLEVKSKFNDWINNQIERAMLVEDTDYIKSNELTIKIEGSREVSREVLNYYFVLNSAKEIAMLNGGEKGKEIRKYFIECEKQLKEKQALQLPQTYKAALLALIEKEEEKEQLLLENNNLNTVLDNLLDWVSILKVAKFNNVHESEFNWRALKNKSFELGYVIKRAESPRYGYQNLYNITVFKALYPSFRYDFKYGEEK